MCIYSAGNFFRHEPRGELTRHKCYTVAQQLRIYTCFKGFPIIERGRERGGIQNSCRDCRGCVCPGTQNGSPSRSSPYCHRGKRETSRITVPSDQLHFPYMDHTNPDTIPIHDHISNGNRRRSVATTSTSIGDLRSRSAGQPAIKRAIPFFCLQKNIRKKEKS